jgi:uncharacterized protein (TIGR03083 family)
MDTNEHIGCLHREAERFAAVLSDVAAAGRLGTTVVTCPEWTIRELAEHTAGLYRWSAALVADSVVVETWRSQLPIEYPAGDDEVVPWFRDGGTAMIDTFSAAPVDRRVWVWGADPHARFWPRRMLHETVVHLADLLVTIERQPDIDLAIAVDGLDEFLTNLPCTARWGAPVDRLRGAGETMLLQPSDTSETWRVRFDPTGFWWDRGGEPADATVSGTAADLYLFLQGRQRPSITITGQSEIVDRWTAALDF